MASFGDVILAVAGTVATARVVNNLATYFKNAAHAGEVTSANAISLSAESLKAYPREGAEIKRALEAMQKTPEGEVLLKSLAEKTVGTPMILSFSHAGVTNYKENITFHSDDPKSYSNKYYGVAHINLDDIKQSDQKGRLHSIDGIIAGIVAAGANNNVDDFVVKNIARINNKIDRGSTRNPSTYYDSRGYKYAFSELEIGFMDGEPGKEFLPALQKANDYNTKYNPSTATLPLTTSMVDNKFDHRDYRTDLRVAAVYQVYDVGGGNRYQEQYDNALLSCSQKAGEEGFTLKKLHELRDSEKAFPAKVESCAKEFFKIRKEVAYEKEAAEWNAGSEQREREREKRIRERAFALSQPD